MTSTQKRSLERADIDPRYHWKPEHIFPDAKTWEAGFAELEAEVAELQKRRGTLSAGPSVLLECLRAQDRLDELSYRVWWYPGLLHDQDTTDDEHAGRKQRVGAFLARAQTAAAWVSPEIIELGKDLILAWLDQDAGLALYRFALEDLFRQQEHILDEEREKLLSYSAPVGEAVSECYSMLANADIRLPEIELSGGEKVQLTHQRYHTLLRSSRLQEDRRTAFEGLYRCYAQNINTYAAIYSGVCKRDHFVAQARGFTDTLDAALFGKAIPRGVFENLIATTFSNPLPLRRYHRLRKEWLGLAHMQPYDASVPLSQLDQQFEYEDAKALVIESVGLLGEDYQARVREAFDGGWIDVYENKGKRSGAYSAPVYGVHPYMLLNYNETLSDLFTLAHEMGHSMHTILSHESQPFVYAHYTIFVAEVASTLNEALLLDHLLQRTEDPAVRVLLLQHEIDSIAATFYTQVLFARFEREAHRFAEDGQPMTATTLGELYFRLLGELYADSVERDELYRHTWARIPHFFRSPYYVYQYATCFASAARLMEGIRSDNPVVRRMTLENYLALLRSGGSNHPMQQLRDAGVDLEQPATIQSVIDRMDTLVDRLEKEMGNLPGG